MIIEAALTIGALLEIGKDLAWICGAGYAGFKAYDWVKGIRQQDFPEVNQSLTQVKDMLGVVKQSVDAQTTAIVNELKEQRQDFRTFYAPPALPLLQHAAVRGRAPARRKNKPSKTVDK